MMIGVMLGETIPIAVQAHDKNGGLKVFATLRDFDGEFLQAAFLYHAGDGLYLSSDFKMPEKDIVIATYEVENNEDYSMGAEKFQLIRKPNGPEKIIFGTVVDETVDNEFKIGVVYEISSK